VTRALVDFHAAPIRPVHLSADGVAQYKIVLLQTQAEAAGAQEISRTLGNELTA
jgi:hypothetical protein